MVMILAAFYCPAIFRFFIHLHSTILGLMQLEHILHGQSSQEKVQENRMETAKRSNRAAELSEQCFEHFGLNFGLKKINK